MPHYLTRRESVLRFPSYGGEADTTLNPTAWISMALYLFQNDRHARFRVQRRDTPQGKRSQATGRIQKKKAPDR